MFTRMTSSSSAVCCADVGLDVLRKDRREEKRPLNAALADRLNEKTAEEQNTENDDYRDDDDLDQAHG